jgi:hypothetical protein
LRNLPPFLKLVSRTSPALTLSQSLLRVVRALLPVATLIALLAIALVPAFIGEAHVLFVLTIRLAESGRLLIDPEHSRRM